MNEIYNLERFFNAALIAASVLALNPSRLRLFAIEEMVVRT